MYVFVIVITVFLFRYKYTIKTWLKHLYTVCMQTKQNNPLMLKMNIDIFSSHGES